MTENEDKVIRIRAEAACKTLRNGASQRNVAKYFLDTEQIYEELFSFVKDQSSYYSKPEPLRHPLIFYYGHTSAFFVNKLFDKGIISERVNPFFESIFAVGVDEMDWDDLNETHYDWPKVNEVRAYRDRVKNIVLGVIQRISPQLNWNSDMWIVLMGIEHERIHFETSAAIIRQLPFEEICSSQQFMDCPYFTTKEEEIPNNQLKLVPSYAEDLHLSVKNAEVYGWDNEFGEKSVSVKEFQASSMLVSNFQFLEFVRAGGYQNYNYWDEQGISWLKSVKPKKPLFWLTENGTYFLRTMNKVMPLPLDWPAEVNNLEATAFCKWKSEKLHKSLRLPTEDEYFAIRALLKKDELDWKHGEVGNINLQYWFSPNPVNMFPTGEFYDIVGNVWQHCCTPIYPFENFQIHPVYEDFTTPTFDGRHFMIKGGSFASTGNEALKRSRYAFRRHFHQFAGFRFVESSNPVISAELIDQTDGTVERFLKLHYQQEKSYVNKVAKIVRETCCDQNEKCLTVGCSVGRIVIEMSKCFKESFGTDYSARFFQMATRILEKGELKYKDIEIYVEDFEVDKRKLILYQMNPENPDPKKLNGFRVMILDGLAIRKGTIHKVIAAMKAVIEKEAYVLIVSSSDTNSISAQQLKEIIGAVEVVQSISTLTSQSQNLQVNIDLYKVKKQ